MDVVILDDSAAVALEGASILGDLLRSKPGAVLGLASGSTPQAMYRELVREHRENGLSFSDASTFNLDEYIGLAPDSPQSYRTYMQRELFDHVDIDQANTFLPDCPPGVDPRDVGPAYEARIADRGGIDLQVLGIGRNGHIGFNEPASSLRSRTRIKTLTRETIEANRQFFDDPQEQPQLAITMGIGTIMDAREILLLATGDSKAEAVRQLVEGPVSALWPATILQMHEQVTVLLDDAAASRLSLRDYFKWVSAQKHRVRAAYGDDE
ncbi:MAG: glucosamine-6-phosphate deaminase [Woeseiaceae bacterium]